MRFKLHNGYDEITIPVLLKEAQPYQLLLLK